MSPYEKLGRAVVDAWRSDTGEMYMHVNVDDVCIDGHIFKVDLEIIDLLKREGVTQL